MTRILEQNVQSGTGTRAAFGRPAAGKTGTNEEHADAWFAGYTPDLATTVWVGYTGGEIPMESVHGIAVAGGTFPAEIWRLFMEPALEGTEPESFPEPIGVAGMEAVHPRRVRAHVRPELLGDDGHRDRDGDDPRARDQTPAARQAGVESLSRPRG